MSRLNPDFEENMMREIVKDWTDYEVDIREAADRLAFAALSQHRLQRRAKSAESTLSELSDQLSNLRFEALPSRSRRQRLRLDIDFDINQVEDEISEITSDIDGMKDEMARLHSQTFHNDFPDFVNLCHSNIRNKARTLLPICSMAYAYAVAGYEGIWPPTLANLERELEELKTECNLAEEQVESFMDDAEESIEDPRLSDRVARIQRAKIDLWEDPSGSMREVDGSENDVELFKSVVNAEVHRRVKRWQVARMEEWVSASQRKEHSKLQAPLQAINFKSQLELMNPPREVINQSERDQHSVSHTASAMWTSPIISQGWYRRVSAPPTGTRRHVRESTLAASPRDDEDEPMPDVGNALVPFAPEVPSMDADDLLTEMEGLSTQGKGKERGTRRNFAEEAWELRRRT